jgi:hypothetical protein
MNTWESLPWVDPAPGMLDIGDAQTSFAVYSEEFVSQYLHHH